MPTRTLSPEVFRSEAQRRLIDTFDLMMGFGLRSKQAIWARVDRGTLPEPVLNKTNIVALWDKDEVFEMTGRHIEHTDRKED
jgi:predicted DNA-binding transcriptional regulator AlpA